jgi:hypothetical protein
MLAAWCIHCLSFSPGLYRKPELKVSIEAGLDVVTRSSRWNRDYCDSYDGRD